jgi:hypothetical protein
METGAQRWPRHLAGGGALTSPAAPSETGATAVGGRKIYGSTRPKIAVVFANSKP